MTTVTQSNQLAQDNNSSTRNYPIDTHGKLRVAYFSYTQAIAGVAGDQIELCKLPAGRVRVLRALSKYNCTALGASRTLSIGLRQYFPTAIPQNDAGTAEDKTTFVNVADVSGAVTNANFDQAANKMKHDLFSRNEQTVFAQVDGGTIPQNAVLEGYIVYVTE